MTSRHRHTFGAVSSDNGRYTIAAVLPGTYTLEARRLGYAPVRREGVVVTAGQATTVDFKVLSAALHLQETVITGVVDPTAGTKVPFTVGRVTARGHARAADERRDVDSGKGRRRGDGSSGAARRRDQHSTTDTDEHQQEHVAADRRRRSHSVERHLVVGRSTSPTGPAPSRWPTPAPTPAAASSS